MARKSAPPTRKQWPPTLLLHLQQRRAARVKSREKKDKVGARSGRRNVIKKGLLYSLPLPFRTRIVSYRGGAIKSPAEAAVAFTRYPKARGALRADASRVVVVVVVVVHSLASEVVKWRARGL